MTKEDNLERARDHWLRRASIRPKQVWNPVKKCWEKVLVV